MIWVLFWRSVRVLATTTSAQPSAGREFPACASPVDRVSILVQTNVSF